MASSPATLIRSPNSGSRPTAGSAASPAGRPAGGGGASPWILSRWRDLVLFIGTPLLLLPIFTVAQLRWSAQDIYLFVGAFGAMGHHLPGMMRAYGDRALFERFRLRFIVAPIFLLAVCVGCVLWSVKGLEVLVFAWGIWHGLMQTYGFCRIYDAKTGAVARLNARLDFALCVSWFAAAVIVSPRRCRTVLDLFYACGGPIVPVPAIEAARAAATWLTAGVTLVFLAHLLWSWRQGRRPNVVKLVLLVTSIGFWWYCNLGVASILVGIALFEVFHDVQYLAIVWVYNRSRVEKDQTARGFLRFFFRRSGVLVGVYVGLVLAYGAIGLMASGIPLVGLKQTLLGVVTASALLHFYYDGFIWKFREKSTREHLGLAGADHAAALTRQRAAFLPPLVHGLKWCVFVAPLALLGWVQFYGGAALKPSELDRRQALVAMVPGDADAHANLGNAALDAGRLDDAVAEYEHALRLRPGFAEAQYFLGIALSERGDLSLAVGHYNEALRLQPDFPQAECNLANALYRLSRFGEARTHYERSLQLKADQPLVHKNLADLLRVTGDLEGAVAHYAEALRLAPGFTDAQNGYYAALSASGRR